MHAGTRRLACYVAVLGFGWALSNPALAGHGVHESLPNYDQGCASRAPENESSLRELVRLLQGRHGVMAVGDRLRCAVQAQPDLAMQLLIPLIGSRNRDVSLSAAKMMGQLGGMGAGVSDWRGG